MKQKPFFRMLLLALIAATVLACLAGCGGKGNTPDETGTRDNSTKENESTGEIISDQMPTLDLSRSIGEFIILNYTDAAHGYSIKVMAPEEDSTDLIDHAVFERNMAVEERYQILITERQNDRPYDLVRNDLQVGKSDYDAAMIYEEHVNRCLVAGALRLFEEIPYLNVDQPWWNKSANDIYSFAGHQYAGTSDWSLSMYSKLHAYLLNKTLFASHPGTPDLYDLVRGKEWTLDTMFRIAADYNVDLDGDDSDIYGIAGTSKVHFQLLLTGSGLHYVEKTDSGYDFAMTSPTANNIVSKLLDLSERNYYNNNPTTHNGGVITGEFVSNRVLLLAGMITTLETLRNDTSNVGVIPAPLFDETQDDYHTIAVGGLLTCFPVASDPERLEATGILVEALSCLSYQNVVPVYKEKLLKSRRADAPDDAEMMDILFRTMSFDLGCSTWANQIRLPIMANVFHPLNKAFTSYFRTFSDDLSGEFGDTVNAILTRYQIVKSGESSVSTTEGSDTEAAE